MINKWTTVSKEILYPHKRISLGNHRVRLPSGEETDYLTLEGYRDYPTVIAIDEIGRIAVLLEHVYPENDMLLQFPEGASDPDETVEQAAARELEEETGKIASKLLQIGSSLHEHRRSKARSCVFIATELTDGTANPDVEEDITVNWMTEAEIADAIAEGKIIQMHTLAAWAIYQAHKNRSFYNEQTKNN